MNTHRPDYDLIGMDFDGVHRIPDTWTDRLHFVIRDHKEKLSGNVLTVTFTETEYTEIDPALFFVHVTETVKSALLIGGPALAMLVLPTIVREGSSFVSIRSQADIMRELRIKNLANEIGHTYVEEKARKVEDYRNSPMYTAIKTELKQKDLRAALMTELQADPRLVAKSLAADAADPVFVSAAEDPDDLYADTIAPVAVEAAEPEVPVVEAAAPAVAEKRASRSEAKLSSARGSHFSAKHHGMQTSISNKEMANWYARNSKR